MTPLEYDAMIRRAEQQMEHGQLDGAIESLRSILAEDPDDATAHALLGLILVDQKRLHAAAIEANIALQLEPYELLPILASAHVAEANRNFEEAREQYQRALDVEPDSENAFLGLARIAGFEGRKAEALEFIQKALEADPESTDALTQRALHELRKGNTDEAEHWLRQAFDIDPEHQEALVAMGHVYLKRGDVEAAREHAIWALRSDPSDPQALSLLVSIKASQDWKLGLWWRYQNWMGSLGDGRAVLVLLGGFVVYRLIETLAEHYGETELASFATILWLAIVAYSWIGPGLFQRALEKELGGVLLDEEF